MTIHEAIENRERCLAYLIGCGPKADPKNVEAVRMSLEALREKAERENLEPLTREELAQMDGRPVWVVNSPDKHDEGFEDEWALVHSYFETVESTGVIYRFEFCGKKWTAYRSKPKEAST